VTATPTSGNIAPGDSQNVVLKVVANVSAGSYSGHLRITGNTPSVAIVAVRLDVVTRVEEIGTTVPTEFALNQNYPNPFNPTTRIRYDLPVQATVSLRVYNLLGQEVITLADGPQTAGRYEAVWDGRNAFGKPISSGVYFYRFEAKTASGQIYGNMRKMLFLK
jgi:hypothetical protein